MKSIPFNVSARTARLIGRENVSSAEGALIELVKNSYDADANNCLVYFDDQYTEIPTSLSMDEFPKFEEFCVKRSVPELSKYFSVDQQSALYIFDDGLYKKHVEITRRQEIEKNLLNSVAIYILDDGHGMTQEIIETSWMTIGTDNKHIDFVSSVTGRVKSGAKGIGRFALDRLGEKCELLTRQENSSNTLYWEVDWSDFDKQGATIDGVNAKLGSSKFTLNENYLKLVEKNTYVADSKLSVANGVHIKVSNVRDVWARSDIQKIYQELESLIPPAEAGGFKVYIFSSKYKADFGEVLPNICDDFDYKLSARLDDLGVVTFDLIRHEIDPSKLSDDLLKRAFFLDAAYTRGKLTGEPLSYKKTIYELLPGLGDIDDSVHKLLGKFQFTLYFLKRSTTRKDSDIFLHRSFDSNSRKKWLDNNNGIRIFRDNFRVRPYGEIGKASWDWLGLGQRQAEDPSALRSGRWKVSPNNVSGVVNISRISNLGLEDKSSREGIQENRVFSIFKSLIEAMIKEFEGDRSTLYREISIAHDEKKNTPTDDELNERQEEDAEKIARKIFDDVKKEQKKPADDSTKLALALLKEKARAKEIDDRLEEMKKENSLLRVFASSGITIASFTHELDSLNAKLGNRFEQLEALFRSYVDMSPGERIAIQNFKNPYARIAMLKRDDERVKNWIKYSLRTIRKDKRKRVSINIANYLQNLRDEWLSTLAERQVEIAVDVANKNLSLRAYEIDLDCIFNNLIINSADAFKRVGFAGERKINISAQEFGSKVSFAYSDSGPGLSKDISNPMDIFKPTFTTKRNNLGEEVGTGLGMWLIEKTIEEYAGSVKLKDAVGFSLSLEM
jgi:signal transduction histidine kinase